MSSQEYIAGLVAKARKAQAEYAEFSQEQLNKVARAAAKCVFDNAELLAKEAVAETHMGTVDGKIAKQKGAMKQQWMYTKSRVSKGIVGWEKGKLDVDCILKIAKPAGIIACVMPVTNPTVTFGSNAMQALKGGNAIIVCPHPRAKKVSLLCNDMIRKAIAEAGAPIDVVQCVEDPTIEMTGEAMRQVDLVVATGGPGMVKAANSSGNPSLGVGQGNVQSIIDKGMSAEFDRIAAGIMLSRSVDSGIPCSCEQTIWIPAEDKDAFVAAINRNRGLYVDDEKVIQNMRDRIFQVSGKANPDYVGVNIQKFGKECGADIPDHVLSLVVPVHAYAKNEVLCKEKLLPVCAMYAYDGPFEDAIAMAKENLLMEGAGHSSDVYTNNQEHQVYAGLELPVCRLPVNGGQGLIAGRPYYTGGMASTNGIGCGYWQKNVLNTNLTFERLLNYTQVLYRVDAPVEDPTDEEVWAE
jgi:succinate-semialdehyde dehydrogenase